MPLEALLKQYKNESSAVIKQIDVTFIQHSLERVDDYDRRNLIPFALAKCSADEGQPRAIPFTHVILRLLLDIRIPERGSTEDQAFREAIGLSDPQDAKYLANVLGLFLRLRPPTPAQTWAQANLTFKASELALFATDNSESMKIYQRIAELKSKVIAFLASAAFTDEEKILPALYAASSSNTRVSSTAEEIIKRTSVSLEDEALVKQLFEAHSLNPAAVRTRILGMLSKSVISTTMTDNVMAMVTLNFMNDQDDKYSLEFRDAMLPLSSLERTKLFNALFQYLAWVARIANTVHAGLIEFVIDYIEEVQGWPKSKKKSAEEIALRAKSYELVGTLGARTGGSHALRLKLAKWLFESLAADPLPEVVVNIDGALSSLASSVGPIDGELELELRTTLLSGIIAEQADEEEADVDGERKFKRSTRHAIVKWANQCMKFSNIYGRWIDILAIAGHRNERADVVEQGHKGLDPWTYHAHSEGDPTLPDWVEMVVIFFDRLITPDGTIASRDGEPSDAFRNFAGNALPAFPVALQYCKHMMFLAALGNNFKLGPDWMQALDAKVKSDIRTRQHIREYLRSIGQDVLVFYLQTCLDGAFGKHPRIVEDCLRSFVEVASLSPSDAIIPLTERIDPLMTHILSTSKEVRSLAARAHGIIASHPILSIPDVGKRVDGLARYIENAEKKVGQEQNDAEGALLAYGYLRSRGSWYDRYTPQMKDLQRTPIHLLTTENINPSLLETALEAYAQLWSANQDPPPMDDSDYSLDKVVKALLALAKKGNEKAIFALGRLAIPLVDLAAEVNGVSIESGLLGKITQGLFGLHELKRVEVQFTVGEALTAAVARWDSDFVNLTVDVDVSTIKFHRAWKGAVNQLLDKLIKDCKATKPSLLKASGIWLFCMVQYCSHLDDVQSRLRDAQAAFMRLLNVRDELVQETASRGLALVYERGDADLKNALVKDLVSAFTGTSTQLKVEEETELFDAGALPTGEGNSITSYKDIVNLANEVGDQTLVYKFMSLAANAATWSTRSAFGRFGLSSILSETDVDPKLYPKLYRYRFDPNTNVQKSMDDIWRALVKDGGAILDTYFKEILDDLLKSIIGREWRVREASCAAVSDLLQGRPFPQYESRYTEIWSNALKVLDDVKGSVREAALKLCMTLSKNIVRQLEENNSGTAAKAMMKEALPFLLSDKGIESSVKDVQIFATITVMDIAKKGGVALRPFIPDMVPQLLGLLSTIEPEQINYHYQRAGNDSRDKIDKLRSQMVNRSPILEAIENSLRFVNGDVMTALAPKLEAVIKSAIGMPTKIGCSRVLTTLFTNHATDVKPVSAKFLQLMQKQAMDKNDEVSQAYARAAAYMIRVVPDAAKDKFCQRLLKMYLDSEEESRRQKVADIVVAWGKVSPDHFTTYETELLPFAYLGSHDTDEYASKMFKEVWNQHAGSSRTVVRYIPEIVKLVERCLDTTQWSLRHTAAFTVAAAASDAVSASDATGEISESNLKVLWPVFEKTLALKTFPGKEKLLESFPKFVAKGHSLWSADDKVAAEIKKIAIREAKRNNDEYRVHAFASLWKLAEAREDLDLLQEIAGIVSPHLDELLDEDKMDVDSKEDLVLKAARNGFEAIARGFNHAQLHKQPRQTIGQVFSLLEPYLSNTKFSAIKREVWYGAVYDLLNSLLTEDKPSSALSTEKDEVSIRYLHSLDLDQPEAGTEAQRIKRVKAVSAVMDARTAGIFGQTDDGDGIAELKDAIEKAASAERSLKVQQEWKDCKKKL